MSNANTDCIFCKIVKKEIPAEIVYEDEFCVVFKDINPVAPIHLLIIPKEHIATVNDFEDANLAGAMLIAAKNAAKQLGISEEGYRLVFNVNAGAGQIVFHVHAHLLAGRNLGWPPG